MSFLNTVEKGGSKSIATGLIGGCASYAMGRRQDVAVLGSMEAKEYLVDAGLLAIESIVGDVGGEYILPTLERSVTSNQTVQNVTAAVTAPVITGAVHGASKMYGTDAENSFTSELALGAGSKLVGNYLVDSFWK